MAASIQTVNDNSFARISLDILSMTVAFICAFMACVFVFEIMQGTNVMAGIKGRMPAVTALRPAAGNVSSKGPVAGALNILSIINEKKAYAYKGGENIELITLEFDGSRPATIAKIRLEMDNLARNGDLESIQLYIDGKLIKQSPFFNGAGQFDNIQLGSFTPVKGNMNRRISVKGKISENAHSGDRVRIGLKDDSSIRIIDTNSDVVQIASEWPLWGNHVSVIGNHILTTETDPNR